MDWVVGSMAEVGDGRGLVWWVWHDGVDRMCLFVCLLLCTLGSGNLVTGSHNTAPNTIPCGSMYVWYRRFGNLQTQNLHMRHEFNSQSSSFILLPLAVLVEQTL